MDNARKSRIWTIEDQLEFAKISGDYNPIHINPLEARRCVFGKAVVHGIHLTLWALNEYFFEHKKLLKLKRLTVKFLKPAGLNERVELFVKSSGASSTNLWVETSGILLADISLEWMEEEFNQENSANFHYSFEPQNPRYITVEELSRIKGDLEVRTDVSAIRMLFPVLYELIPWEQIALLLMTTHLVGMECPGLYSMYSELDLDFLAKGGAPGRLQFEVSQFNNTFKLAQIRIRSLIASGCIKAFVRPSSSGQFSVDDIKVQVTGGEFKDQKALIIGGSRGLGEATAKILSLGGAEVFVTFAKGQREVLGIRNDLEKHGCWFKSGAFDVLDQTKSIFDVLEPGWRPTHLYYFATPFIFDGVKMNFSPVLFENFCKYYVLGFWRIFEQLRSSKSLKFIMYPSSSALSDLPANMFEYSVVKSAGESLCAYIQKYFSGITVSCPRFERLATDQTVSLLPVGNKDPIPVLLKLLREQAISKV